MDGEDRFIDREFLDERKDRRRMWMFLLFRVSH